MKGQKSILSFFRKPSSDNTQNNPPPSYLSSDIRGTDTPPEKVSRPIFSAVSPTSDQKRSDSLYSHILNKFKREEESSTTKKRNRDDYSPLSSCLNFDECDQNQEYAKKDTSVKGRSKTNISRIKSNLVSPVNRDDYSPLSSFPKFDEFYQNEENTKKDTSVKDRAKTHISRVKSNNLSEDDFPSFDLFPDITGPETPAVRSLVPRLKRVQETGHESPTCGSEKRAKNNEHLLKDETKCRETSESSISKFEWLNTSSIRDAIRRRPGDPLYDKRTLFIPPDALKNMSASQKQYWSVKCEYMDIVLFFKVGKFYELYELDAEIGQKELDWKMTISGVGKCRQVGISEFGIDDAVEKLTARGYKVGRIEQLETSDQAKAKGTGSVIERRLVQVFTPATTVDSNIGPNAVHLLFLKEGLENGSPVYGFAFLDYAALKFSVGSIADDSSAALGTLLMHVSPKEIVYENTGLSKAVHKAILKYASSGSTTVQLTPVMSSTDFQDPNEVMNIIHSKGYFKRSSSSWNTLFDCLAHRDLVICALGGLVVHLVRLKLDDALRNGELLPYHVYKSCLRMDGQTLLNLEIFSNNVDGGLSGTLYQYLGHCMTLSGKRLLRRWICHPLKDIDEINDRLNVVDGLMNEPGALSFVIENLRKLPDLERLLGRVKATVGSSSTLILPFIGKKILKQRIKSFGTLVKGLRTGIDLLNTLLKNDTSTLPISNFVKLSLTSELNETLKQFEEAVDADFPLYQNHEIENSDAETLSVLTGLFIEKSDAWSSIATALDHIDVLQSFASTAISSYGSMSRPTLLPTNYKPTVSHVDVKGPLLKIKGLWHPYAVKSNGSNIVPNDLYLGEDANGSHPRALLLTGPNMGGKSTLLRATCLAVILAQLGCYVPCDECVMSPADVIFTRLGAMDRIMAGESTFFVECSETASILHNATQDSLVLLDELGRGTSTFDGYAIAYAVFRHLVEAVGCRLLFATHYHPLTKEFASHPRVLLQHMACAVTHNADTQNKLVFLYKLASGPSPESYGLQVALMAGIPDRVVEAASKASAGMKSATDASFKSSEERSGFSTLHEEWIKALFAVSRGGDSLDEDGSDTLFCLWHEMRSYYGSRRGGSLL